MLLKTFLFVLGLFSAFSHANAQSIPVAEANSPHSQDPQSQDPQSHGPQPHDPQHMAKTPDSRAHLYTLGIGMGLSLGGSITWKYSQVWTGRFQTIDEGWFGRDTYAGGADKLGHMYTDFVLVRGLHWVYTIHNYDHKTSVLYAFLIGSATRTIMEVGDGMTTYKFSPGDLAFNMLGSSLSSLLLLNPELDETFHMSWSYLTSREALNGHHGVTEFSTDYSGSVFTLETNLKGLRRLTNAQGDSVADKFQVGINYFTRNFRQPDTTQRTRNIGVSLGLNMAEFLPENSLARPLLRYYKLPFSYAGFSYNLDKNNIEARYGLNYLM